MQGTIYYLFFSEQFLVFGSVLSKAKRHVGARYNGDLQQGIGSGQQPANYGVARLMICNHSFLCWRHCTTTLLCATHHSLNSVLKVCTRHNRMLGSSSVQCCLVTNISDVRSCTSIIKSTHYTFSRPSCSRQFMIQVSTIKVSS